MTQAIPVSQIVTVNPGVVSAGGSPLSLNAIFVDMTLTTPTSSLLEFYTQADVAAYYGSNSKQAELASNYFLGFDGSTRKPGTLFFAGYADTARAAWLQGESLAGMTLDALQAVSGTLSVTIDATAKSSATVDLSTATSFTDAAYMLTGYLSWVSPTAVTWNPTSSRFVINSGTTGTASSITYATGNVAEALGLDGGIISQGADVDTPLSAMDRIKDQSQNWATFTTVFEPVILEKEEFSKWTNTQNNRYAYIPWDEAAGYKTPNNPAVFGTIVDVKNYEGTCVAYGKANIAAFLCGYVGSINWQELNGRATAAFKSQGGLEHSVDSLAVANAVLTNNASYYGLYQAPGQGNIYSILYNGQMNGSKFRWLDTYVNQIYLNAQLQQSIFTGLMQVKSAPYNSQGETLIRAWCADPIAEALNNGSIRTGVALSQSQKAAITMEAGLDISDQLYGQGYYLQILPATAQVRQQRQSPPVKLWYMDGGSIQAINLASIAVL